MRRPAVAGQFYAASGEALRTEIEACYVGTHGPGALPGPPGEARRLAGLVVPHAGYLYSGPVAAHAYAALARDGLPETFVILGPNHTGRGMPLAVGTEDFETPLGVAQIDQDLAEALLGEEIAEDREAHRYEHSIEVQLPFLLHLTPAVRFVPLCMGVQDLAAAARVGGVLAEAVKDRDVLVLASTDFSHYVPREVALVKDRLAIDQIVAGDAERLYETVQAQNVSMCGYGPVMAALKALPGARGTLLKYGTSADAHPMPEVVGYAAITLET